MAVSGGHLYWANEASGTVVEAGLDGTSPQVIAAGQGEPFGVAADGSHLCWTNFA